MSSHSSRRKHRRCRKIKSIDLVILITGLVLIFFLIISNQRFKINYAKGGQEDDVVLISTTTKITQPPVENNKAIFDLPFNYISYSKIVGIAPRINTAEQFQWSAERAFNSIEGDVQITSDDKLVMNWHDGVTTNKEGKIIKYDSLDSTLIRDMTEKECLALRHNGQNTPMCTFDEYVKICKEYKKIAFITIGNEYLNETIPKMIQVLKKYDMLEQCIVNSYYFASLKEVRKVEPIIVLSKMMDNQNDPTKESIDIAASMGNCIVSGSRFSKITKVTDVEEVINLEILDYAKSKNVRLYETQIRSTAIANKLKEYGYSGAQMVVAPVFE